MAGVVDMDKAVKTVGGEAVTDTITKIDRTTITRTIRVITTTVVAQAWLIHRL